MPVCTNILRLSLIRKKKWKGECFGEVQTQQNMPKMQREKIVIQGNILNSSANRQQKRWQSLVFISLGSIQRSRTFSTFSVTICHQQSHRTERAITGALLRHNLSTTSSSAAKRNQAEDDESRLPLWEMERVHLSRWAVAGRELGSKSPATAPRHSPGCALHLCVPVSRAPSPAS